MSRTLVIHKVTAGERTFSVNEELNLVAKDKPIFEGRIAFVNGYHSDAPGGIWNAIVDIDPDHPHFGKLDGKNLDENDRDSDDDVYTQQENEADIIREEELIALEKELGIKDVFKKRTIEREIKEIEKRRDKFYGYWNLRENGLKASHLYASYFNAENHQYFVNGSHGLASSAAHRIDHAIALGYAWAKEHWGIKPKKEVDQQKSEDPYQETFSPAYTPVSIVGHSQGSTGAFGFALGVLHYAAELDWDAVPINLIVLGTHQPKNLTGDEYEEFVYNIRNFYEVNANIFEGRFWKGIFGKKDKKVLKHLSRLAQIFSFRFNKIKKDRGIYEHLKELQMFHTLKDRAIQFTFANDRPDFTSKDGDIPEIDNACNTKGSFSLYSIEFFEKESDIPAGYLEQYQKRRLSIDNPGVVLIPKYIANQRVVLKKEKKKEALSEVQTTPENDDFDLWDTYINVAKDWGNAFSTYYFLRKELAENNTAKARKKLRKAKKEMIYQYGRVQEADLYTHFTPVSLVINKLLLKDWNTVVPDDSIGIRSSVWDRMASVGDAKFYRVNTIFDKDEYVYEPLNQEQYKSEIEDLVTKKQKMIRPVQSAYVQNVIDAFVNDDQEALSKIYKEPDHKITQKQAKTLEQQLAKKYV